ncbi:hypothetical protein E2C01_028618 [Portunus trituberculatus]|uniref:Uncharacterized protein n=1 Tax=Portunus trituberculatus TaxID=210409 RepID=A0A5B7EKX9_PORTR|nr:hypothetical protein [Portunus trituberculatus]
MHSLITTCNCSQDYSRVFPRTITKDRIGALELNKHIRVIWCLDLHTVPSFTTSPPCLREEP